MDAFHKLNLGALVVLSLITATMLGQHLMTQAQSQGSSPSSPEAQRQLLTRRLAEDQVIFGQVADLLGQKNFALAREKLQEIKAAHPDNPTVLVYLARLHAGSGRLIQTLDSYRRAVDRDPVFLDRSTPLFIGNEISDLINEARSKLQREKRLKPDDQSIQNALENLAYLQRRIAGGCE